MTQNYLPKDAADYPKTSAARTAMVEIAQKYIDEYQNALNALAPDDKLQKKVGNIQKHMAEHCQSFAAMGYNNASWAGQLARREAILNQQNLLPEYEEQLKGLTPDERGAFIQYAHTNWFLHNAFIDKHIQNRNAAVAAGHPEKAFEDRMVLGTVYAICREWRQWWLENGTLAFDRWTYEDAPYETEEE
ncbi:MAG: hypothetical protein ACI4V1_02960 [Eubacteriales bacterium]